MACGPAEIQRQERRLQQKDENLNRKLKDLDRRESGLQIQDREIEARERQADELRVSQSGAGARLRPRRWTRPARSSSPRSSRASGQACARRARELELEAAEQAEQWARRIIGIAIQRYSSDTVGESRPRSSRFRTRR